MVALGLVHILHIFIASLPKMEDGFGMNWLKTDLYCALSSNKSRTCFKTMFMCIGDRPFVQLGNGVSFACTIFLNMRPNCGI